MTKNNFRSGEKCFGIYNKMIYGRPSWKMSLTFAVLVICCILLIVSNVAPRAIPRDWAAAISNVTLIMVGVLGFCWWHENLEGRLSDNNSRPVEVEKNIPEFSSFKRELMAFQDEVRIPEWTYGLISVNTNDRDLFERKSVAAQKAT